MKKVQLNGNKFMDAVKKMVKKSKQKKLIKKKEEKKDKAIPIMLMKAKFGRCSSCYRLFEDNELIFYMPTMQHVPWAKVLCRECFYERMDGLFVIEEL